ncbi:MAG: hypothetical protein K2M17_05695, partial [Bacilli bacterium]|nr:hypothetical protein [Bacilli bacterium]
NAKSITVNVSPTPTSIYYSTTTQLTPSNYSSSGSTTKPTRTEVGTTTVYWCAYKANYETYCSSNTIKVLQQSPTFTISSTSAPIGSGDNTSSITYVYTGDATVTCTPKSPSTATYASCSIDTSTKTITFTRLAAGTQTFTISAPATTNFKAGLSKTVTVEVANNSFATYIKSQYTSDGVNNLYKHDGNGSYTNYMLESGGGEYRFSGSYESTNNYVCFGTTATTCSFDYLYRIIGVFGDRVKLIKFDYTTSSLTGSSNVVDYFYANHMGKGNQSRFYGYYWNTGAGNLWEDSQLYKTKLNVDFINNIGSSWANLIDTTVWNGGGVTWANGGGSSLNIARTAYDYEVGNYASNTTYSAKVGLLYMSDYYYAADPAYWSNKGYEYNTAVNSNWMYMGGDEWSISRRSGDANQAFCITYEGAADVCTVSSTANAIRPVFYLKSDVSLVSGTGSRTSPYRILE